MRCVWVMLLVGCVPSVSTAPEWATCDGAMDHSSWSRVLPGEMVHVSDIATDCVGNIVAVGPAPGWPTVITKLDSRGDELWSSSFDLRLGRLPVVATGPNDHIVAFIYHNPAMLLGLGPDGREVWTRTFDGAVNHAELAVAPTGDIAVAASFPGRLRVGPAEHWGGGCDMGLVAMFDESGEYRWSSAFGAKDTCTNVTAVAIDHRGDVIVTGHATTGAYMDLWFLDMFMIKYDGADGSRLWLRQYGGRPLPLTDGAGRSITGLAIDQDNGVVISATTNHSIDLGDGLVETDVYTGFVARYDGDNGGLTWIQTIDRALAWDVEVDRAGEVIALAADVTAYPRSAIVTRYTSGGQSLSSRAIPYNARSLAVDGHGNVVAAGSSNVNGVERAVVVRLGATGPSTIP